MKKITVLLTAGFGVAMLTGCQNHQVMQQRYCKNAEGQEVRIATAAKDIEPAAQQDAVSLPQEVKIQDTKPAKLAYEPMEQLESDKFAGISDNAKKSGKKSGKRAAVSGKSRIYKVKSGDTPGKIAYRHKVSVAALMQANNLTEESAKRLQIGQKLVIPAAGTKAVYSKKAAGKGGKAVKAAKQSGKTSAASLNADGTYSIKRGDTPERIARKLKVKLADLLSANNLDESASRRLQIGQKLVVPGSSAVAVTKSAPVKEEKAVVDTVVAPEAAPVQTTPAADVSGNDLAAQLENAAPAAGAAAGTAETTVVETDNIVSHVVLEKEISLADFAAQQKTTVEELRRINKKPLPDVLTQNFLIDIPFAN